ncbi:hypothetical protein ASPWEDRAFT_642815 [Aspergillus wentii DTO 134E9]|uniref:Uncharacterized protein n=1 Tax=Aspergillus wentii DTO 134E9 TaxID=1073089 RepID=A0A1L9RAG6_ASPWE|nr:uncharacterized protein ASPWEDRAFT_642815 [Aspergillus wentii DTO 134E9]OJJ31911.1 hypothetical protein ASPWEDRAFT_642815 [Aspergillus wentii DTO 134E9]
MPNAHPHTSTLSPSSETRQPQTDRCIGTPHPNFPCTEDTFALPTCRFRWYTEVPAWSSSQRHSGRQPA